MQRIMEGHRQKYNILPFAACYEKLVDHLNEIIADVLAGNVGEGGVEGIVLKKNIWVVVCADFFSVESERFRLQERHWYFFKGLALKFRRRVGCRFGVIRDEATY